MATRAFSSWSDSASRPRPESTWARQFVSSGTASARGSCDRYPVAGARCTVPLRGVVAPPSTRRRVVLPAPLRPTRPTLSPGRMSSDAPRTIVVPPTSTVRFLAVSTVVILRTGGRAAMPGPGGEPPFSRVALRATARVRSVRCRMRWDPIAAVATDDPYPLYRELRDAAPVYHDPE